MFKITYPSSASSTLIVAHEEPTLREVLEYKDRMKLGRNFLLYEKIKGGDTTTTEWQLIANEGMYWPYRVWMFVKRYWLIFAVIIIGLLAWYFYSKMENNGVSYTPPVPAPPAIPPVAPIVAAPAPAAVPIGDGLENVV